MMSSQFLWLLLQDLFSAPEANWPSLACISTSKSPPPKRGTASKVPLGKCSLFRLTPVLTALSCRVLSPKWLRSHCWDLSSLDDVSGLGPAPRPCLLTQTVSVSGDLAVESVVSWACAQKGCNVNAGCISSLEMSCYLLNSYSSLSLPQPDLLIKY